MGGIAGVAALSGLRSQDSSARILALAVPFLLLLKALPRFLAPRLPGEPGKVPLTLDAVHGAAVGRLQQQAQEALQVSGVRKLDRAFVGLS